MLSAVILEFAGFDEAREMIREVASNSGSASQRDWLFVSGHRLKVAQEFLDECSSIDLSMEPGPARRGDSPSARAYRLRSFVVPLRRHFAVANLSQIANDHFSLARRRPSTHAGVPTHGREFIRGEAN